MILEYQLFIITRSPYFILKYCTILNALVKYPAIDKFVICKVRLLFKKACLKTAASRASLVAQWLRICLPMQGTRVRALVWEDPTCRGATGPVSHNY